MDLYSLDGDYRYHPLAALVELGELQQSPFYVLGFDPEEDVDRISKILHEVAHASALRTTRLGFWVARVASEILAGRQAIPDERLTVPLYAQEALGAYAPFLEGLALYGQLDYEAESGDDTVPFPLVHVAMNNVDLRFGRDARRTMRLAQMSAMYDGLLDALFMKSSVRTAHYFVGYLYVKVLAARFGKWAPELDSGALLPLLNRLICDHPILERVAGAPVAAAVIARAIHESLSALNRETIVGIAEMLRRDEIREGFDHWDIHAQVARGVERGAKPIFHSQESASPLHANLPDKRWYLAFRGAASLHLTSWTSGRLVSLDEKGLVLRSGQAETRVLLSWRREIDAIYGNFEATLASRVGSESAIVVANYLTLTKGGGGFILWIDDEPKFLFPLSLLDGRFDRQEGDLVFNGAVISPLARRRFARSLEAGERLVIAIGDASDVLLESLISNPLWRRIVSRDRLAAFLDADEHDRWRAWRDRFLLTEEGFTPRLKVHLFDTPLLSDLTISDLMPGAKSVTEFKQ